MPVIRQTEENDDRSSVISLLERIASVILPIGVALYAVLYLGVEEIYATFGINPQQAGIDQSVLFSRLMSTLVLVVLLGIPLIGLLVGLGWLVNVVTFGAAGRAVTWIRSRPWVAGLIAALWCGATYWGFYNFFADLDLTVMVVIAVGLGLVTFLVPFQLLRRRPVGRAGLKVLIGALTGLGLGFLLILNLASAAQDMRETGQANFLLSTVGFQDQWAILEDKEKGTPLYDGRWMMLLGEREGTYLIYDCDKMETIRRPMESAVLTQVQLDPEREADFTCGTLAEETG